MLTTSSCKVDCLKTYSIWVIFLHTYTETWSFFILVFGPNKFSFNCWKSLASQMSLNSKLLLSNHQAKAAMLISLGNSLALIILLHIHTFLSNVWTYLPILFWLLRELTVFIFPSECWQDITYYWKCPITR